MIDPGTITALLCLIGLAATAIAYILDAEEMRAELRRYDARVTRR